MTKRPRERTAEVDGLGEQVVMKRLSKELSFSERIERRERVPGLNPFHFPQFFGANVWVSRRRAE